MVKTRQLPLKQPETRPLHSVVFERVDKLLLLSSLLYMQFVTPAAKLDAALGERFCRVAPASAEFFSFRATKKQQQVQPGMLTLLCVSCVVCETHGAHTQQPEEGFGGK